MNINIAICDDKKFFIEHLSKKIIGYSTELNVKNEILTYNNPEELLNNIDDIDILFLDVDMPEMSGIEVARRIRESNESVLIVFVSNYDQYVYQSIKYKPFRYIRKNRLDSELYPALKDSYNNLQMDNNNKTITIDYKKGKIAINKNNILYIEKELRDTVIHLVDDEICTRMNLKDIEKELDADVFIKLHRGCIANMKYIERFEKDYVYLINGKSLPISRRKVKEVKESIKKYWLLKS